jgi:hypothetical protein
MYASAQPMLPHPTSILMTKQSNTGEELHQAVHTEQFPIKVLKCKIKHQDDAPKWKKRGIMTKRNTKI